MSILVLKITSSPSQSLVTETEKIFNECGGKFGRDESNDWVLPDEERFLSTYHGQINFKDGQYRLTDISTNGIYIRNQNRVVGKDNDIVLNSGDELVVGDYIIVTEIKAMHEQISHPLPCDLLSGDSTKIQSNHSEPLLGSSPEHINAPNFDPLSLGAGSDVQKDVTNDNYLKDSVSFGAGAQEDHSPAINDSFKLHPLKPILQTAHSFESTQPLGSGEGIEIPEDWNAGNTLGTEAVKVSTDHVKLENIEDATAVSPAENPLFMSSVTPEEIIPKPLKSRSNTSDFIGETTIPTPVFDDKKECVATASSLPLDDVFSNFITAAGLNPEDFSGVNQDEVMKDFGALFRDVIQGMMELLRARSELKNEFRISQTMIRSAENNPLKISLNASEALRTMFLSKQSGYLSPQDSIHEGINDIRTHQVAMISGMQAAFSSLMNRLNPEQFIEDKSEGNILKATLMSLNNKTRAWEDYRRFYQKSVVDSGNAFQILFGNNFADAYQKQSTQLNMPKVPKNMII